MSNDLKGNIQIEKDIKNALVDNITKQNLATYINKYLCDTIYILQIQINSIFFKKNQNKYIFPKNQNTNSDIKIYNDELNIIKLINNSLEKEIFYLNNSKKPELSKFIEILCKRNELLNILMLHYFEKEKLLEKKEKIINEKILNEKIKTYSNNITKRKSWDKYSMNSINGQNIDKYMDNIKKNNEYYNHKRYSKYLNTCESDDTKDINNNKKKNKIKSTLNKSYDVLSSINNIDTSSSYHNNYEVNYTYCDIKQIKNQQKRNSGNKLKLKKNNSVSSIVNRDSIINYFNNKTCFKLNSQIQLNKLNLDKLNNITSNVDLLKQIK